MIACAIGGVIYVDKTFRLVYAHAV
jgi:hypothetical protein